MNDNSGKTVPLTKEQGKRINPDDQTIDQRPPPPAKKYPAHPPQKLSRSEVSRFLCGND